MHNGYIPYLQISENRARRHERAMWPQAESDIRGVGEV
jgi:hypothetical protein